MTQHNDDFRLRHILDHAQEALKLAQGKARADLDADRKLELALTRKPLVHLEKGLFIFLTDNLILHILKQ